MSAIKTAPSQERLSHTETDFVTGPDIGGKQRGLQTIGKQAFLLPTGSGVLAESGSVKYTITATGHDARAGDFIRWTIGSNIYVETPVSSVTTNTIILGATPDIAINAGVDRFNILRYVTPVLANDGTTPINVTYPAVIDFCDTPLVDLSSTPIPKSSSLPLELVASVISSVRKILVVEDIGEFFGLYTGLATAEVLAASLPLGGGEVELSIAAGTRISIRHMKDTDVVAGFMSINFLG